MSPQSPNEVTGTSLQFLLEVHGEVTGTSIRDCSGVANYLI